MNKFLILCLLGSIWLSCSKNECNPQQIDNCITTMEYNPVCGCDDVTYGNPGTARCNNVEFTLGSCEYSNDPFIGKWTFLGYKSDGAQIGLDKKKHSYEMYIVFKNDKDVLNDEKRFVIEGKSAVNFIGGNYRIRNKNAMSIYVNYTTKIGVADADLEAETKYVNFLNTDMEFNFSGTYLELSGRIYSQDGLATPHDEVLIFRKN